MSMPPKRPGGLPPPRGPGGGGGMPPPRPGGGLPAARPGGGATLLRGKPRPQLRNAPKPRVRNAMPKKKPVARPRAALAPPASSTRSKFRGFGASPFTSRPMRKLAAPPPRSGGVTTGPPPPAVEASSSSAAMPPTMGAQKVPPPSSATPSSSSFSPFQSPPTNIQSSSSTSSSAPAPKATIMQPINQTPIASDGGGEKADGINAKNDSSNDKSKKGTSVPAQDSDSEGAEPLNIGEEAPKNSDGAKNSQADEKSDKKEAIAAPVKKDDNPSTAAVQGGSSGMLPPNPSTPKKPLSNESSGSIRTSPLAGPFRAFGGSPPQRPGTAAQRGGRMMPPPLRGMPPSMRKPMLRGQPMMRGRAPPASFRGAKMTPRPLPPPTTGKSSDDQSAKPEGEGSSSSLKAASSNLSGSGDPAKDKEEKDAKTGNDGDSTNSEKKANESEQEEEKNGGENTERGGGKSSTAAMPAAPTPALNPTNPPKKETPAQGMGQGDLSANKNAAVIAPTPNNANPVLGGGGGGGLPPPRGAGLPPPKQNGLLPSAASKSSPFPPPSRFAAPPRKTPAALRKGGGPAPRPLLKGRIGPPRGVMVPPRRTAGGRLRGLPPNRSAPPTTEKKEEKKMTKNHDGEGAGAEQAESVNKAAALVNGEKGVGAPPTRSQKSATSFSPSKLPPSSQQQQQQQQPPSDAPPPGFKPTPSPAKPLTPGKIVPPSSSSERRARMLPSNTSIDSDIKTLTSSFASGSKDGFPSLSEFSTAGSPFYGLGPVPREVGSTRTHASSSSSSSNSSNSSSSSSSSPPPHSYKMADPGERKKMMVPLPPSGRNCGCGSRSEGEDLIHWKDDLPIFAGIGMKNGRIALAGGGGMAGMGVGSGIKIYDVRPNCALVPFATFDSNDKLVNCIAEHPCGSEIAVSMEGSVYAFLTDSVGESFEPIDSWTVIPPKKHGPETTSSTTDKMQPQSTTGDGSDDDDDAEQVTALEFNFGGDLIATGGEDGNVRVWKYQTKQMIGLFDLQQGGGGEGGGGGGSSDKDITSIAFSCDSKHLIACNKSQHLFVYSLSEEKLLQRLQPPPQTPNALYRHFRIVRVMRMDSSEGKVQEHQFGLATLVETARNGWSYLAKVSTENNEYKIVGLVRAIQETVTSCSVSNDGVSVALNTSQGSVVVINTLTMARIREVKNCHHLPGTALCFTSAGDTLVSASMDKSYVLIPVDATIEPEASHGCVQGVVRLLVQMVAVVLIAHLVTYS